MKHNTHPQTYQDDFDTDKPDPIMNESEPSIAAEHGVPLDQFKEELDTMDREDNDDARETIEDRDENDDSPASTF